MLRLVAMLVIAGAACVGEVASPGAAADAGGAAGTDGGEWPPGSDSGPAFPDAAPAPTAGDGVVWLEYPSLHARTDGSWDDVLTDIVQHCPAEQVDYYMVFGDLVASGHEVSHAIHAHLRNNFNTTGTRANGFYVLDNRAALVDEPDIRKSDAIPHVPDRLRGSRFELYLVGQTEWDDTPLYVWDEWNAYVNGTEVGVDLALSGRWDGGYQDVCAGPLEFVVYSVAIGLAVEALDPSYFAANTQFREFLAWNLRRSMAVFRECSSLDAFGSWESIDSMYADLRTHADAEEIRAFLGRTYGDAFVAQLLAL
jgi:hypothetical protein